jgi:hypothetical protein
MKTAGEAVTTMTMIRIDVPWAEAADVACIAGVFVVFAWIRWI